jgi:hypothetical protein
MKWNQELQPRGKYSEAHARLNQEVITEEVHAANGEFWCQRSRWRLCERLHVVFVQCSVENNLLFWYMTHAGVHVMRFLRVGVLQNI